MSKSKNSNPKLKKYRIHPTDEQVEYFERILDSKMAVWEALKKYVAPKYRHNKYTPEDLIKHIQQLKMDGDAPSDIMNEYISTAVFEFRYNKMGRYGLKKIYDFDTDKFMAGDPRKNKLVGNKFYIAYDASDSVTGSPIKVKNPPEPGDSISSTFIERLGDDYWQITIKFTESKSIIIASTDEYVFTVSDGSRIGKVSELEELIKKRSAAFSKYRKSEECSDEYMDLKETLGGVDKELKIWKDTIISKLPDMTPLHYDHIIFAAPTCASSSHVQVTRSMYNKVAMEKGTKISTRSMTCNDKSFRSRCSKCCGDGHQEGKKYICKVCGLELDYYENMFKNIIKHIRYPTVI